jgi:hypothetical protein
LPIVTLLLDVPCFSLTLQLPAMDHHALGFSSFQGLSPLSKASEDKWMWIGPLSPSGLSLVSIALQERTKYIIWLFFNVCLREEKGYFIVFLKLHLWHAVFCILLFSLIIFWSQCNTIECLMPIN